MCIWLQDFSLFPNEDELLMLPGAMFEVKSVTNLGHDLDILQCSQVNKTSHPALRSC